ncbi:galectin-4-like isoform X2 [Condylostylus longicornis]|uniref:galectin-4-like isoform X2 n=1 Tax=Condylostylus longicornis TaxID=2530218 RepID=UPI00244DA6C2|nr:galectin-4-like isoform X2 [Condylostylus longicornis]
MNCVRKFCSYFLCCSLPTKNGLNESTFFDHDDPELIYENSSLGEIKEGVSFIVSGTTLHNCERFSINLILDTPTHDIALHFNPRLPQNYIVRNCKIKNVWSTEEVASIMPFVLERGKSFTLQILITEEEYLLSVNGHHFAAFRHRLPYTNIKCLEVKGDVKDIQFERTVEKEYPKRTLETMPKTIKIISGIENAEEAESGNYNLTISTTEHASIVNINKVGLKLPYYAKLPENFKIGQRINIEGRIKILPHSFFINLQSGHNIWPHPTIPFHFNPRFAVDGKHLKHIICKNSWIDGKWNQEERNEIISEFAPGRDFCLGLFAGDNCYEVYLNEKFIANYQHRTDERKVDTIYIQGDVHIWNVTLVTEGNSTNSQSHETINFNNAVSKGETKWV